LNKKQNERRKKKEKKRKKKRLSLNSLRLKVRARVEGKMRNNKEKRNADKSSFADLISCQ
jgi:hypothetical protein